MTAQEMIKRYHIVLHTVWDESALTFVPDGKINIQNEFLIKSAAEKEAIVAMKPEILSILMDGWSEKQRKEEERKAKIEAIDGLKEIKSAMDELDAWQAKFERSFYGPGAVGGMGVGPKPAHDIDAMKAAHPRAAAYIMAKDWSFADHDVKASAGKKALEKIINGDDYSAAIDEMQREWDSFIAPKFD